jgi:hypothetical protein
MKRMICFSTIALAALLIGVSGGFAQSSGSYDLTWHTIDGGGASFSTGGAYSLGGSIGQPDAGVLSGGSYMLNGGFWSGASVNYPVYLPLVRR